MQIKLTKGKRIVKNNLRNNFRFVFNFVQNGCNFQEIVLVEEHNKELEEFCGFVIELQKLNEVSGEQVREDLPNYIKFLTERRPTVDNESPIFLYLSDNVHNNAAIELLSVTITFFNEDLDEFKCDLCEVK